MNRVVVWLAGFFLFGSAAAFAQDLSGIWQGTLQAGNGLRTVVKISEDDKGAWKGTLYSVDQGGAAIAMSTLTVDGKTVQFTIKTLDVSYTGTLSADGKTITGNATQNGQTHALNLQHVNEEETWAIPKPPKPMPADAHPKFEVVTIKPAQSNAPGKNIGFRGRDFLARNFNVNDLIGFAFGLHTKQIVGAPDWFNSQLFDIQGVADVEGRPNQAQMNMMMESLLLDRFKWRACCWTGSS